MSISTLWGKERKKMYSTFNEVITQIKDLPKLPHGGAGEYYDMGEQHRGEDETHSLTTFQHRIFNEGRFEEIQVWNHCSECQGVRNSKIVGFDHKNNLAHVRYFTKHGEARSDKRMNILKTFSKEVS